MKRWFGDVLNSFPVQLFFLQLYRHLTFTIVWLILALFLMGSLGKKFGFDYLFLTPEYRGNVNETSFFFVGMAFGSLFMTWNLTLYLLTTSRFHFLATLSRPFTKFCYNNFILPTLFLLTYFWHIIKYLQSDGLMSLGQSVYLCAAFLGGGVLTVFLIGLYLNYTNKDILSFIKFLRNIPPNLIEGPAPGSSSNQSLNPYKRRRYNGLTFYIAPFLKLRRVRSTAHYDPKLLENIFSQNHKNALLIQLFLMFLVITLGSFSESPSFRIPAGASIFLLSALLISIGGFVTYYFGRWRFFVTIVLLYLLNSFSTSDSFEQGSRALGMDYQVKPKKHNKASLLKMVELENIKEDKTQMLSILNNWKAKQKEDKPPIIFLCISGGGLKNALWAVTVLDKLEKMMGDGFLDRVFLMTGASGGLIGASYYRSLYLEKKLGNIEEIPSKEAKQNISKDILNAVSFSMISNDLFFPWSKFEFNGQKYKKDRGVLFENQLIENTNQLLDVPFSHFKKYENEAFIPMIWYTPVDLQHGRKLFVSNQNLSFMTGFDFATKNVQRIDGICINRYFPDHEVENLRFSSAIRMSATYPLILPSVALPSDPSLSVIDAGVRDNYGVGNAARFIKNFSNWLEENTSDVMILEIVDESRDYAWDSNKKGIIEKAIKPVELASQLMLFQHLSNDQMLETLSNSLAKNQLKTFQFVYRPSNPEHAASISFHLSELEKRDIEQALTNEQTQLEFAKLKEALKEE